MIALQCDGTQRPTDDCQFSITISRPRSTADLYLGLGTIASAFGSLILELGSFATNLARSHYFFFLSLCAACEHLEHLLTTTAVNTSNMDVMDKAKDSFLELLATLEGDELLSFETFVGVAIGNYPAHTFFMILS